MEELTAILIVLAVGAIILLKGKDIMGAIKGSVPGPADDGSVQLAYLHWRTVRRHLGLLQSVKTASGVSECFKTAGLASLFDGMGYDWKAIAAICLHETGYGTSTACYNDDNLFGISDDDVVYSYTSMAACVEHFLRVVQHSRYDSADEVKSDGPAFLAALNADGYNSTTEWKDGVLAAYDQLA
jgi:hypothetical protein